MKNLLRAAVILIGVGWAVASVPAEVGIGDSLDRVMADMGEPKGKMNLGKQTVLVYPEGNIVLENGRVVEIGITAERKSAVERQRKEAAYDREQQAKGKVKYEGLWLTPEDRDALVKDRLKKEYPAGRISMHACSFAGEAIPHLPPGGQPKAGAYHYSVYLPHDYYEDETRRYPCMFVASPSGDADMKNMEVGMVVERWIVIMLVESRNEAGWPVMGGNFLAAHDDAMSKLRIIDSLKFATGMSGGARACTLFASMRDGFAGLILQAAGFWYTQADGRQTYCLKKNPTMLIAAIFGTEDPNNREIPVLEEWIEPGRLSIEAFEGGHVWAPPECVYRALDWMERALFEGLPPERRSPDGDRWYRENEEARQGAMKAM